MIVKVGVLHRSIWVFKAIHWGVFFFNLQVNFSQLREIPSQGAWLRECASYLCHWHLFLWNPGLGSWIAAWRSKIPINTLPSGSMNHPHTQDRNGKSCVVLKNASCLCCSSTVNGRLHSAVQEALKDFGKYSVGRLFTHLSFENIQRRRSVPMRINSCYANKSCEINRSEEIVIHWDTTQIPQR